MQHTIEKMNSKQVDIAPLRNSWAGLHVIHVPLMIPTIEAPQTIDVSQNSSNFGGYTNWYW